jgi:hypothetical protein
LFNSLDASWLRLPLHSLMEIFRAGRKIVFDEDFRAARFWNDSCLQLARW